MSHKLRSVILEHVERYLNAPSTAAMVAATHLLLLYGIAAAVITIETLIDEALDEIIKHTTS